MVRLANLERTLVPTAVALRDWLSLLLPAAPRAEESPGTAPGAARLEQRLKALAEAPTP